MENNLPETTLLIKEWQWRIVPDEGRPDYFNLEEAKTGKVLGTFILPEDSDPKLINLIASAPELQDIAEMSRDHMIGNSMEKTMVFSLVMQVLERAEQPYEVEVLECV